MGATLQNVGATRNHRPMPDLTVRESMALELAGRAYRDPSSYVGPARELLGMSETRFHQVVGALLERPEAEAAHPEVVHRLRRVRDGRRRRRAAA